jgi:hypothetical protein
MALLLTRRAELNEIARDLPVIIDLVDSVGTRVRLSGRVP